MARTRPNFDKLLVQDYLEKDAAMAYTLRYDEKVFNDEIGMYCIFRRGSFFRQ